MININLSRFSFKLRLQRNVPINTNSSLLIRTGLVELSPKAQNKSFIWWGSLAQLAQELPNKSLVDFLNIFGFSEDALVFIVEQPIANGLLVGGPAFLGSLLARFLFSKARDYITVRLEKWENKLFTKWVEQNQKRFPPTNPEDTRKSDESTDSYDQNELSDSDESSEYYDAVESFE